jgi:hypothetical protein
MSSTYYFSTNTPVFTEMPDGSLTHSEPTEPSEWISMLSYDPFTGPGGDTERGKGNIRSICLERSQDAFIQAVKGSFQAADAPDVFYHAPRGMRLLSNGYHQKLMFALAFAMGIRAYDGQVVYDELYREIDAEREGDRDEYARRYIDPTTSQGRRLVELVIAIWENRHLLYGQEPDHKYQRGRQYVIGLIFNLNKPVVQSQLAGLKDLFFHG